MVGETTYIHFRPPANFTEQTVALNDYKNAKGTVRVGASEYKYDQNYISMYNVKNDTTTDNELVIIMEVDVPTPTIKTGTEITQTISYKKKDSYTSEFTTVDCKTTVTATGVDVDIVNKRSDIAPSTAGTDTTKLDSIKALTADPYDGLAYYSKIEDSDLAKTAYKLEEFGANPNTKTQRCSVTLKFPKTDFNPDMFGDYEMEMTAQIKQIDGSVTKYPTKGQISTNLKEPTYDDSVKTELSVKSSAVGMNFLSEEIAF